MLIGLVLIILTIAIFILGIMVDTKINKFYLTLGFIVGIILVFISSCIIIIDPGTVGVVNVLGSVSEQPIQAGIHIVTPFITQVIPFSVKTQENTQVAQVLTSEGLDVSIDLTVLYRLDPSIVPSIYKTVGKNYKDVIIDPQIRSVVRDIIANYDAKNIYSADRSNISQKIQVGLETPLGKRGILVESVLLRSAQLPTKVKEAIESKQQMEQAIQQKQFEVQKEQMEAQRKVAEAQGIADANAIISNSITPEYIEWYTITMMETRSGDTYFIPIGDNGLPLVSNIELGKSDPQSS